MRDPSSVLNSQQQHDFLVNQGDTRIQHAINIERQIGRFNNRVGFRTHKQITIHRKIIPDEGDTSWVEDTILDTIECLNSNKLRAPGLDCDFCKYQNTVRQVVRQFEN